MVSASLFGDNNDIPPRPSPPRLVNDFTGTLNRNEVNALERKLVRFNDTTSTQIVVVLINSLEGYDKAQFADLLGEKWGVGQKGKDNGIVVLVKPKVGNSKGQAFIASGYGLEGAVPDAVAKRIVDNEMIPEFMQNRYYAGLEKGTGTLMELTAGEYTADEYMKR
nr:TPM domain-containing protein [Bacteroidota bacterium]